jgi:hypothetical protein
MSLRISFLYKRNPSFVLVFALCKEKGLRPGLIRSLVLVLGVDLASLLQERSL